MSSCNHTSVGMLVWHGKKLLLIERRNLPYGFAPPAGHVDDDEDYEIAAMRELKEEVHLKANSLKLVAEGRKEIACGRPDGTWHYWKIYEVQATGTLRRNKRETKQVGFYDRAVLKRLADRTKRYLHGEIAEEDWQASPGLEPVWLEWLQQLRVL